MLAPFPYIGGKHLLAKKIIAWFPPHVTYVEPFGGAANVLLNKEPSEVEVYNDLNSEVYNFFRVLRERCDELVEKLRLTPYSRREFVACLEPSDDPLEQARRTFVKFRQGYGAKQTLVPGNWLTNITANKNVPAFLAAIERLPEIALRLRSVYLECLPASEVITKYDTPNTLFYLDPPYLPDARKSKRDYDLEMTADEHVELARLLHSIKGRAVISGYPSELYETLYGDWDFATFDVPLCRQTRREGAQIQRRTEVIWANFALQERGARAALF